MRQQQVRRRAARTGPPEAGPEEPPPAPATRPAGSVDRVLQTIDEVLTEG